MQGNLAARFALAVAAELAYIAGRTWLIDPWDRSLPQEFLWSAWRVPFVVIYFVLARPFLAPAEKRRGMPLHPLLLFAIGLSLVEIPVNPVGEDFPFQMALAAAAPIVGLREEFFYRGIFQGYIERFLGPVPAILVASLAFTLYHIGAQDMNALWTTGTFAFGVILGAVYQRTGNIWLVAAIHSVIDMLFALSPRLEIEWGLAFLCSVMACIWALAWWRVDYEKRG